MEIEYDKLKLRHGSPRIEYRFPTSTENTASDGEVKSSPGGYFVDVVSTIGQQGRSHTPHNDHTFIFQSKLFESLGEAGAYVGEFVESLPEYVTVPVDGITKEQS